MTDQPVVDLEVENAGSSTNLRSAFSIRDLISEAIAGMLARPTRMAMTALGTVLGVGALVATLGLAETAGAQIVSRFDELAATEVRVTPESGGFGQRQQRSNIPFDAQNRLERLNGVVAAGTKSDVNISNALVRSVPVIDPLGQNEFQIPVLATSDGLFAAVRAEVRTGRVFDSGHNERGDEVAVLGPAAAKRLNIFRVDQQPVVFVGDQSLTVIGILSGVERQADMLNAIIIPDGLARARFGLEAPAEVHIDTEVGAAGLIATQAALALSPNEPDTLDVQSAPEPQKVRAGVEGDVNALFLILGGLSLLIGAIGIANVTLVSVLERIGEIGLRRSFGATRRHIASQFLIESTAVGALGGIIGTSAGILTIIGIAAIRDWTPVLTPWLPIVAPFLGAITGLLAGTYPAWKASATEPIAALRGSA